jgi:hypothetical protein
MFKTDKPFGFAHKDLLWVYQNIKGELVMLSEKDGLSEYKTTKSKRTKIFIVTSVDVYSLLCSTYNKLKGKFIVLDTEEALHRIRAITLDKDNIQIDFMSFIKSGLNVTKPRYKIKESNFKKESKNLIHILSDRVHNQNKVFKKTYQTLNTELLAFIKKKISAQKFNRYKKYLSELLVRVVTNNLPYDEILNIKLGNEIIINKDGYRDVQKYCECASSIRTIQAFQDVIINKTPVEKALLENYGDAFSLNMMLNAWHPKSATFTENYSKKRYKGLNLISKESLLSKDLLKRRNKTDIVSKKVSHTLYVKKGIMKVENLVKKLKLPEDEYRVVGAPVKDNKVNIVKEGIALHGIHSNKIFSIIGIH